MNTAVILAAKLVASQYYVPKPIIICIVCGDLMQTCPNILVADEWYKQSEDAPPIPILKCRTDYLQCNNCGSVVPNSFYIGIDK